MKTIKKIGVILALLIGVMSVFAGTKVLIGLDVKEYNVLTGLVIYNIVFGAISMLAAYFLWKETRLSKLMIWFILLAHLTVFIYLNFFNETAAYESKVAMLFRISMWILIALLSVVMPRFSNKKGR